MKTLILLQTENNTLSPLSAAVLCAAQKIGAEIDALLLGSAPEETLAHLPVRKIYLLPKRDIPYLEGDIAAVLKDLSKDYTHILGANSTEGKNILPRLAGLLDVQPITEVTSIESADIFIRPIYAGAALTKIQSHDSTKILLIRPTSFEPQKTKNTHAPEKTPEITTLSADSLPAYKVTFLGRESTGKGQEDLESAKIILSGGKGFKSKEAFETLLSPLAKALGAAIGASRAAVDSDFAPNELQIGQTGKIVAPEIYFAIGLSGAPQHLAGIKDSKHIFALNIDPQAPIFNNADYGLEGDLFEILPLLTEELQKRA